MPNVYVGQYADIRHGAVYPSITEAVKEVNRVIQAGLMIAFVNLPDTIDQSYWIAGTVGKNADPRRNLIFLTRTEAQSHREKLHSYGFPSSETLVKELKIQKEGPRQPDIKTEEHLRLERKHSLLLRALERGLQCDNSTDRMEILVDPSNPQETKLSHQQGVYSVQSLINPLWATIDPVEIFTCFRNMRSLVNDLANCDPDTQPIKWNRLKATAVALSVDPSFPPASMTEHFADLEAEETPAPSENTSDDLTDL